MKDEMMEKTDKQCVKCGKFLVRSKRTGFFFCLRCAGIPYNPEEVAKMQREMKEEGFL